MSCMMLTAKQIWTLAATLTNMFNIGLAKGGESYSQFGLEMNGVEWERFLRDNDCLDKYGSCKTERLARLLHATNLAAYNGRYSEHQAEEIQEEEWARFVNPYCHDRGLARYAPGELSQWHFDFLALLEHYIYQIEEDATRNSDVLRILHEQASMIEHNIVHMDPRMPSLNVILSKLA